MGMFTTEMLANSIVDGVLMLIQAAINSKATLEIFGLILAMWGIVKIKDKIMSIVEKHTIG